MVLTTLCVLSSVSLKRVATITANELYKMAPVIVTADVESLSKVEGVSVATAKVRTVHKGKPKIQTVSFVAERTWTCDTSRAVKGERVLLYLVPTAPAREANIREAIKTLGKGGATLYSLAHSGRGRIPITLMGGSPIVNLGKEFDTRWEINTNLVLPNAKFVHKTSKDTGIINVPDLLSYQ